MNRGGRGIGIPLLVGLAVVSIFAVAFITFIEGWDPVAIDYGIFWRAAHRPVSQIYQAGAYFVYPPPAIPLFEPLAVVPFWPGYVLWIVISATLFFLAAKRITDGRTALVAMFSSASLQNLLFGQTPMLLSAGLLWALTLPSLIGGVILGCLGAMKPQLFVMAPFVMLVRRDWAALMGIAFGGLIAILLSLVIFGFQPWLHWIAAMPSWERGLIELRVFRHVITPSAIGMELGINPVPWWLAGFAVAVFATVRLSRKLEGANLAALIVGASTLSVPYALPHDLVGAMPALAVLILSAPSAVMFATATIVYVALLLPVILPAVALGLAWRYSPTDPQRGDLREVAALTD